MQRFVSVFFLMLAVLSISAQEPEYKYEVGIGGGMSWAYGDVNRSKFFYKPGIAGDLLFRYNLNPRWSFVAEASCSSVKGDSKDFDNTFLHDRQFVYDNHLWQISVRPEFHFWNYGWANDFREKKRLSPFITIGGGVAYSTGDGATGRLLTMPVGAGAKWKVSPRFNVSLTCLFTRTFGDGADGVRDPNFLDGNGLVNSDWVGSIILGITFDFKERCFDCLNKNF